MVGNVNWMDLKPLGRLALAEAAIQLHPLDEVAIARITLPLGTVLVSESGTELKIQRLIPVGHKIALRQIAIDEPVRRYGQIIGFASQPIPPGEQVHVHNLSVRDFARDYAFGADARPVDLLPAEQRRTFMGYRRWNGRVGTRNYVAVISTVNCSAHVTRAIAHTFTPDKLADYPNVDGVIPLAHLSGCGSKLGGEDYHLLQRTLAGMANHANIGAYILVGLGCEINQLSDLIQQYHLDRNGAPPSLTIQEAGGTRKTIDAGVTAVEELLPQVNAAQRGPQPVSELVVGLQCGGSDGWSGVTANPVLGMVSDEIVRQGGTTVLAETTEIYGAEHLLTRRAASPEVGRKLVEKVRWWEQYTARMGIEIDNNPSVGNKVGGLTTIYEKSLGAVAKGGTSPLTAVYDYAEPITTRGFSFMDTPGYDPVSVTGQVAGGCNLVVFTTGRGSAFGFKPAPSIKVATNTETYTRMIDDMDVNAGQVLAGVPMQTVADELLELVIAVASGQPSKSEALGIGEAEFNPWSIGGTL